MMNEQLDTSTFDFAAVKPKLRDDLKVSMKTEGGEPFCILEDTTQNRFFRIGFAEYTLISLFDGKTTITDAVKASSYILGVEALNEREAAQICDWMISNGLAQTRASISADRICESEESERRKKWGSFKNPLMIQTPLWTSERSFSPDRFFEILNPLVGWLVSFFGAMVWIVAACCGVYFFATANHDIQTSLHSVVSANQWVSLAVVGIVLKLIHELAHGVACKRFGGQVSEVGVFWFLFIPLPYVDVSSSWAFDRNKRMLVAAAGILVELFVVAIAIMVWSRTSFGVINQLAAQTILLGSMVTVIFNANPLMRFDGYFLLSDLLKIPNLAVHGRNWIINKLKGIFFGIRNPESADDQSLFVPLYGTLALFWQLVVLSSILFAASNLMNGVGLMFVLLGITLWLLIPLGKLIAFLLFGTGVRLRNQFQFVVVMLFLGGLFFSAGTYLPSPEYISIEVVARYEDENSVRNTTTGFVDQVFVRRGQAVRKGDAVLQLSNPELRLRRSILAAERKYVQQEIRSAKATYDIAKAKSLLHKLNHVVGEIEDVELRLNDLIVRAPSNGMVVAAEDLNELKGRYLHSGTEVCLVVDGKRKKLTGLVAESQIKHLNSEQVSGSQLIVWGGQSHSLSKLNYEISPSSSRQSPHFALTSMGGGSHTVVNGETVSADQPESWVLAKSRFEINMPLPHPIGGQLKDGQRCLVKVRARQETLGEYVVQRVARWAQGKIALTHGI